MELTVEALNGHKGVLYRGLHGDPELVLLLAKLEGYSFQDLGELPQDLQGNMPVGSGDFSLGDHPIRADREFIHDLAGYMTIGNRDISFWLEFWMRAKEGNLLSRQHQKICCRDFKAISRESSCPFMTGGNLIEGNSQFPRKKFPRWADRLIPFLGFKQRHGAIIFYQYEIHLPLFLIPDIHQLKKAQAVTADIK